MSDLRLFGLLGTLIAGLLVGERLGADSAIEIAVGAGILAALAMLVRDWRRYPIVLIATALLGSAVMQRSLDGLEHWPLAPAVTARADASIAGELVDDPTGSRFSTYVRFRTSSAEVAGVPRATGGRMVLIRADGDVAPRLRVLDAGDRVVFDGWLRPLEGYDERYRWRHVVARFDATELRAFSPTDSLVMRVANSVRARVLDGVRPLPAAERGVVSAFLVGDTRALPPEVVERFRSAGMSHLLVVSGQNIAFVLALVGPVLRRFRRPAAFVGGLAVVFGFGVMTRWEPSVLRAGVMAGCAMTGVMLGRPVAARRVLALAVVILLLADPFLVHSVGFLLSCGACAGIVALGPWLSTRCRGPQWFREILGTTAAAQLGVTPVLLQVFGSLPLVSLPANLVAVPLAALLTSWGLVTGVVGGLVPGGLAGIIRLPTQLMADAMLGIADLASRAALAVDGRGAAGLVFLGALFGLARRLRRHALVVPPRGAD